jgi:hypothetical protein
MHRKINWKAFVHDILTFRAHTWWAQFVIIVTVRRKLAGMMNGNGSRQKVAHADDIEQLIAQGWEFVSSLPNGKVILKLPF